MSDSFEQELDGLLRRANLKKLRDNLFNDYNGDLYQLKSVILRLTEREARTLCLAFCDEWSIKQIADVTPRVDKPDQHVSPERIRQITLKALRKLRWEPNARVLKGEWNGDIEDSVYNYLLGQRIKSMPPIYPALCDDISDIDELFSGVGLSVRSTNAITRLGIETVGELSSLSIYDLLKLPNFGRKSLGEVRWALSEYEKLKSTKVECEIPKAFMQGISERQIFDIVDADIGEPWKKCEPGTFDPQELLLMQIARSLKELIVILKTK